MLSECLECSIGGERIAIPVSAVDQIADYVAAPAPPLAEAWIGGLGSHGGTIFITLALAGQLDVEMLAGQQTGMWFPAAPGLQRKGVLLKAAEGFARWAIEVDAILKRMYTEVPQPGQPWVVPEWRIPQKWLLKSQTQAGEELGWLDVEAIANRFQGV